METPTILHGIATFALLGGGISLLFAGNPIMGGYLLIVFGAMFLNGTQNLSRSGRE